MKLISCRDNLSSEMVTGSSYTMEWKEQEGYCYDPFEVVTQVSIHQERLRYDMKNFKVVCIAAQVQTEYL